MSITAAEFQKTGSDALTIWKTDCERVRCIPGHTPTQMDEPSSGRRKKADKAKDKKGRPSSKHVRQYEANQIKRGSR